jgi:hypothetical protein
MKLRTFVLIKSPPIACLQTSSLYVLRSSFKRRTRSLVKLDIVSLLLLRDICFFVFLKGVVGADTAAVLTVPDWLSGFKAV